MMLSSTSLEIINFETKSDKTKGLAKLRN